jgi:4-hydroxy-3-methylbut-2-en-1-yl diphosphate reductase
VGSGLRKLPGKAIKMKINLAKSAGFCFGVKRALSIAMSTAGSEKKIYMLGDIVHNEDVVRQISRAGIKKISRLSPVKSSILLIRAHGSAAETIEKASSLGYRIVDATCPMVKEIHKIARIAEEKGRRIIVIGDKNHDEVQGIIGQLKTKAIVIDSTKDIPWEKLSGVKNACVVVQSTQNVDKVLKISLLLKKRIKNLEFHNTVCNPTRTKQGEIRKMPLDNDVMLIIGSRASANTKRLYEISKSLNKRTYWITSKEQIKKTWFKEAKSAGVTAGASTPDSTTNEVIEYLKRLS